MKANQLIAFCGLDCMECAAYKATVNDDGELRRRTAEQWTREFKTEIRPADINCLGCTAKDGPKISHCSVCEIRACAVEKKVGTCAGCAEYPCGMLDKFFAMVPAARAVLDGMRFTT